MRVTIDVDEETWKELTEFILKKHQRLYGKYRRNTVNDVLKLGLKALKRSNVGDFKKSIMTTDVSEAFLKSLRLDAPTKTSMDSIADVMSLANSL